VPSLFVDDDVFHLREGTEMAYVLHSVYERVGHILGFIVQEKSNLPIKCLKSSDCADFTYRQINVHKLHFVSTECICVA